MLTLITPTGARPDAFYLCQKMMAAQDFDGAVHWIIVDDGPDAQEIWFSRKGWRVDVIRPAPLWQYGQNTQQRNLQTALEYVDRKKTKALAVIEDDDYYAQKWLSFVDAYCGEAELIGEGWALYYNVFYRTWDQLSNDCHCSLRCSAMRDGAIDMFQHALNDPNKYYDQLVWKRQPDKQVFPRQYTVGIKGMPGRAGIAIGHDRGGCADPDLRQLNALIGVAAADYAAFSKENPAMKTHYVCVSGFDYGRAKYHRGDVFNSTNEADAEVLCRIGKIARVSCLVKHKNGESKNAHQTKYCPPHIFP